MLKSKITLFLLTTILVLVGLFLVSIYSLVGQPGLALLPLKLMMISAAFVLSFQGIFTLFWMLYAWEDPEKTLRDLPPKYLLPHQKSFSLLVPARFESQVIGRTIQTLARLRYKPELFEVLILCRDDDDATIASAARAIYELQSKNIKLHIFSSELASKPSALNIGLAAAKNEIVGVFDAEDEPHALILDVVNTVFLTRNPAVVQAGVQLMNYHTAWFSPLNILEYYFWYKSALHLFNRMRVVPLGGNTVFFDKVELQKMGGWAECLTEDAEIGLRLSAENKRVHVVYDPYLITAEESPSTLTALLKQRTRWNQGFFQILLDKKWLQFADFKRRCFALYFLLLAQLNALNFVLVIFSLATLWINLPIVATLVVMFPLYLLGLQLLTQLLGYYEFTKDFKQKFSLFICAKIIIGFIPYQLILALGALRASVRQLQSRQNWEKTDHQNLHRLATT